MTANKNGARSDRRTSLVILFGAVLAAGFFLFSAIGLAGVPASKTANPALRSLSSPEVIFDTTSFSAYSSPGWIVTYQATIENFGSGVTYAWTEDGSSVGSNSATLSLTIVATGSHTIALTVTDSSNDQASFSGVTALSSSCTSGFCIVVAKHTPRPGFPYQAITFSAGNWQSVSGLTNPVTYSTTITPGTDVETGNSWDYTFAGTGTYTMTTTATDVNNNQTSESVGYTA